MTTLYLFITFFILSAAIRAIDHLELWGQGYTSWLPDWIWGWETPFRSFDSRHFWMGLYLLLWGIAHYFLGQVEFLYRFGFSNWILWTIFLVDIYIYFQIFNLFFHVIWKSKGWKEFPFFRIFLT